MKVLSYGVGNQTDQNELSIEEANQRGDQCIPAHFANANLILSNNAIIEKVSVKYDYKEKVLLVQKNNKVTIGAPNIVKSVQFLNPELDQLINVGQLGRSYGRQGFYTVLANTGDNYLVSYQSIEEKNQSKNEVMPSTEIFGAPKDEPVMIQREDFLISENQKLYVLENFKSKALSQFGDRADLLKSYVKQEKLKFKNVDDLKKFAQYLWTL
ncbi:hypothetical protein [Reichenbachiella faecimaris]|nr:hypothetical protein [Reichenbachiella faecimaris]